MREARKPSGANSLTTGVSARPVSRTVVVLASTVLAASSLMLPACGSSGSSEAPSESGEPSPASTSTPGSSPTPDASSVAPEDAGDLDAEPPPPPCDDAQTKAIQAAFADETVIPAAVGAVGIVKDSSCGTRYFARGASKDVPATALHNIGSATKTYIASLTLLLIDDGKLSLTDSVTKWVPNVPGGDAVHVDHLLHHTSGIYNYTGDSSYMLGSRLLHQKYKPQDLLNIAIGHKPSFAPGADGKWEYSNTNYVLLGMIIESITGKDVAQVLHERILTPIGAQSTFYAGTDKVTGDFAPSTTFLGASGATAVDPSSSWACGNVTATIGDIVDWEERRGNGTFHSPAAQAELTRGVPTGASFAYGAALVMVPAGDPGLNGNGPAIGHGGDIDGYHTLVYYFPEKKVTIGVILDSDKGPGSGYPFGETYLLSMYMQLVNPYFGTKPPTKP